MASCPLWARTDGDRLELEVDQPSLDRAKAHAATPPALPGTFYGPT